MLTDKYKNIFIKKYSAEKDYTNVVIEYIQQVEKETKIGLLHWENPQIVSFLKKINSESPQTLNVSMVILRKFANFIAEKEKLPQKEYPTDNGMLIEFIDRKQLMKSILTYEQYINVKNQLDMTDGGERINVRDKLIFELAWVGLTNEEIKLLKMKDIEFTISNIGLDVAILKLKDKIIRVEDAEVVKDIKLCEKETYCIKTAKDGKTKKTFYKDSEYLIKPVNIGRVTKKNHINNPSVTLNRACMAGGITCEGIDIDTLCINDIRRSKLIYLLAPQNEDFFDIKTISGIYNLKSPSELYWLKEIAKEKYTNTK